MTTTTKRKRRVASPAMKEFYHRCLANGLKNYRISKMIGYDHKTTLCWKDADYKEKRLAEASAYARKMRKLGLLKTDPSYRAHKANIRRVRKQNAPELVFLDGEWCEVDREETWLIFSSVLLPNDERQAIRELYLEAQRLTQETGVEHHIDHIQPLSKGGEHLLINLQVLPAGENIKKNASFRKEDVELLAKRLFDL